MVFPANPALQGVPMIRLLVTIILFSLPSLAADRTLTLTMGGDINFNVSGAGVQARGAERGGLQPWSYFTQGIAPLINGDLNFANIETVVTERNLPGRVSKAYNFQTHTNGLRHLLSLGFNLLSLANNHAYDYGYEGYQSTLDEMQKLKSENPGLIYHGVGRDLENAIKPVVFRRNGVTIAFAAIGIMDGSFHARADRPGMINPFDVSLRRRLLSQLRETRADYKILSVHYGTENMTGLDGNQRAWYHQMLEEGDVDLIIGHHPHVTRPVEAVGHKLIFYSLGNYLMLGAKDMGNMFGLFARLQLKWDDSRQRMRAASVQAVPLTMMHIRPSPLSDRATSALSVQRLNDLSRSQVGASAVIFQPQTDGTGRFQFDGWP